MSHLGFPRAARKRCDMVALLACRLLAVQRRLRLGYIADFLNDRARARVLVLAANETCFARPVVDRLPISG